MTIRQAAKIEAQKRAELVREFAQMTPAQIAVNLLQAQAELAEMDHEARVSPSDELRRRWHEHRYASLSRRIDVARNEISCRKPEAA